MKMESKKTLESSPLDYVAESCSDLTDVLSACTSESARDTEITNHIKKVWATVLPVDDFKQDLEWVNVSEPISLSKHCSEKIVVLDFWTYCCINCYHILPDLDYLESTFSVESGVVVIGVHCAKFNNEKDTSNILLAVQRYGIKHAVVNDAESTYWNSLGIRCWPTLLVLGPGNKPLFVFTGEGHREELVSYVGCALKHFNSVVSKAELPMSPSALIKAKESQVLKFPGKLALNPFYRGRAEEPFLAISDTGHHRILFTDCSGKILRIIGGPYPGFQDGKLSEALFNSPQGLCWLSRSVITVCDTNNHAVRALHLDDGTVETLAGTGHQAAPGDMGGKILCLQPLSSPWDVLLYTTPDMDMSVRNVLPPPPGGAPNADKENEKDNSTEKDSKDDKRRVLLVACAGSHQIWAIFLDDTIWWKYKSYPEGTCICVAGSGTEAARNSAYPHTAAFAQPSGLALKNAGSSSLLYIADSESSSIRKLALSTGHVSTLCGGDKNPINLFAYGDVDDIATEAKLQHPLDVAYLESTKTLYIADSYNHKIKKVDVTLQKVTSLYPTMIETADPAKFNEPSGLSISPDGKYLYIADTNNHSIKLLNVAKNVCQEFKVRHPEPQFTEPDNLILYKNDLFVNRKCGSIIIYFNVSLDAESKNVKFTPGAPQHWNLCVRDEEDTDVTKDDFEFVGCSFKGSKLPGRVEMKLKQRTDKTHYRLYLSFHTALCDSALCFTHVFTIRSTILVRDSVKMVESYKITCKVNPVNKQIDKSEQKSIANK